MWRGGCPTERQKQTVTAESLISQTFFLLWLFSVYTQQQAQTSKASGRDVRADGTSQTLSTRDHQGKETQSESRTPLEALASRMFSWCLHTDPTSGVKSMTKNTKDSHSRAPQAYDGRAEGALTNIATSLELLQQNAYCVSLKYALL